MSGITTLLWDVGGVLLTNGWDHTQRDTVLARFGLQKDAFEPRHAEVNDAWEKGLMTGDEYLAHVLFYAPRDFTPGEFLDQMKQQSKLLPDSGIRILEKLAASQDLELGILNNEARELNDHRFHEFGLIHLFDCFVSSCYVGLRKPDPKIYQTALDLLQRSPAEVIFIDDRAENIAAAVHLGMQGIQFQGSDKLSSDLAVFGIQV